MDILDALKLGWPRKPSITGTMLITHSDGSVDTIIFAGCERCLLYVDRGTIMVNGEHQPAGVPDLLSLDADGPSALMDMVQRILAALKVRMGPVFVHEAWNAIWAKERAEAERRKVRLN